ncbi:MAG: lamin tail domain-containing protein, partial [Thermoguttaceae bacterium]
IWGTNAAAGGQLVIDSNTFGSTKGRNDIILLSAGSAANGDPVPQILNNTFSGGGDEALDLDGDCYIEGNVFSHFHKDAYNSDPTGSNAISAGDSAGLGHNYTAVRNVFYDVDHAVLVKDNSFLAFVNDTVASATLAAVYFNVPGYTLSAGRGANVDGAIFSNCPTVFSQVLPATSLTINRSIVPSQWQSYGASNTAEDPRLVNPAGGNFSLSPGSPALGAGPYGLDMGAIVPGGPAIAGEPTAQTTLTSATLAIGGPGVTSYKYCVNNGAWSAEIPIATPVQLTGLANGTYTVYVVGKNAAGAWQSQAAPTASKSWTVNNVLARVRINEVLAINHAAVLHGTSYPDLIELYNDGAAAVDLTGMGISDDPANASKFVFPAGTLLGVGQYLVLYADSDTSTSGLHLGFNLSGDGGGVYLFDTAAHGSGLLDSVEYGPQAADLSIGRIGHDGDWTLTQPTFGAANVAARTGNPATLKINEWLASENVRLTDDFLELYNPDPLPVPLAGLSLTDYPISEPGMNPIAALSFVAGGGYIAFTADGNPELGPDHLNFKLSANKEWLGLYDASLNPLDTILHFDQTTDYSQGRSPDGGASPYQYFAVPTPAVANAPVTNLTNLTNGLRITEIMYNPLGDGDLEFIELKNVGTATLDLTGVRLTDAVTFTFPAMLLAPNQYVVVARNAEKFSEKFGPGINLAGEYNGKLSDGGDHVVLQLPGPYDAAILRFDYQPTWYPSTAGGGYALAIRNTAALPATWSSGASWQVGTVLGGSPGRADNGTVAADVIINEVLIHTDEPLADSIELYNTTGSSVNIGGWYLSDSSGTFKKFRIPDNTTIAAHGYAVFYMGHWVSHVMQFAANEFGGANPIAFGLNSYLGDDVWLTAADSSGNITRVADDVTFGPMANGESLGRWPNGTGNLYPMLQRTLGQANDANGNGPRVGPVIIRELMYQPNALTPSDISAGFTTPDDIEFIEIYNPTASAVDLTHWHLAAGVTYDFPAGMLLGSHQSLAIVSFDPANAAMLAAFKAHYGMTAAAVVGPYSGHLSDFGEKVQLQDSDTPPLGMPDYWPPLLEDEVVYSPSWGANGNGLSLNRVSSSSWGDSSASWTAAAATPGDDATPPAVVSIISSASSPTNAHSLQFTVTFSESVTGVDAADFALALSGTSGTILAATPNGTTWTVTVNNVAGNGTLGLNLVDNDTILDQAGNRLGGTGTGNGNFTGQTYTIDTAGPTVSIGSPSAAYTRGGPITYTVTYADANFNVSTLSPADVTLNSTGTANGTVSVSGSDTSYTVTISSITGDGSLGISIAAGTAWDLAGNQAPAAGPSSTFAVGATNVLTATAVNWTDAGLTLKRTSDGMLHLCYTDSGADAVTPMSAALVGSVQVTGRDNLPDTLTIDFSGGNPIPAGGLSYDGGPGSGADALVVSDAANSDTVTFSGSQLIFNGAQTVTCSNTQDFSFDLGNGSLDLGNGTQTVGGLTMLSGNIMDGSLSSNAFNVQGGSIAANLTGAGALNKTGTADLTLSGANTSTGGTTINRGTIIANSSASVPVGGAIVFAGGNLVLNFGASGGSVVPASAAATVAAADGSPGLARPTVSSAPLAQAGHRAEVGRGARALPASAAVAPPAFVTTQTASYLGQPSRVAPLQNNSRSTIASALPENPAAHSAANAWIRAHDMLLQQETVAPLARQAQASSPNQDGSQSASQPHESARAEGSVPWRGLYNLPLHRGRTKKDVQQATDAVLALLWQ